MRTDLKLLTIEDLCRELAVVRRDAGRSHREITAEIERRVNSTQAENAALRERVVGEDARCRRIAQGIIETIGSVGPENAEDAAARACAEILCLRERVAAVEEWTHRFGSELSPSGKWTDSFGDGIRAAKERVSRILAAAKPAAQEAKEQQP